MIPKLSQNDAKMFPKWSQHYPKIILNDTKMMPKLCQNYIKLMPKWSHNDPKMYIQCIYIVYIVYTLYIHCIYNVYTLYIHCIYNVYTMYIQFIAPRRKLFRGGATITWLCVLKEEVFMKAIIYKYIKMPTKMC